MGFYPLTSIVKSIPKCTHFGNEKSLKIQHKERENAAR